MASNAEMPQLALNVERWIAEARGGSRASLDKLLEASSPYLLAAANRELYASLRSRVDPVDVLQDTLLKAWQHFPDFRGDTEADWLAWLRQIFHHNLANLRREHIQRAMRSIRREVPLPEAAAMLQPDDADDELGSPDRQVQSRELYVELEVALRRLPERYRQVLRLHTQEGLTFSQVGGRLCCSTEAARKLWRRAIDKLAQLLADGHRKV